MARIQTETQQDLQAPGVSLAPVTIQPSPIAQFAEKIMPIATAGRGGGEAPKPLGNEALLTVKKATEERIAAAEEAGELDDTTFQQIITQGVSEISALAAETGVDPSKQSALRKTYKASFMADDRFTVTQEGNVSITKDNLRGGTNVKVRDPELVRALAVDKTIENFGPGTTAMLAQMSDEDRAAEVEELVANTADNEQIAFRVKGLKADKELGEYRDQIKKRKTRKLFTQIRGDLIEQFNRRVDSLRSKVASGVIDPEQAKEQAQEEFNAIFRGEDAIVAFADLGDRDAFSTADDLNFLVETSDKVFKAADPNRILTRDTLAEEQRWRRTTASHLNNLDPAVQNAFISMGQAKDVALDSEFLKILSGNLPGGEVHSLLYSTDNYVRNFRTNYQALSNPLTPEEAQSEGSPLRRSAANVMSALQNIKSGYTQGDAPAAKVSDALLTFQLLSDNPNFKRYIGPKTKRELLRQVEEVRSVFKGNKKLEKLFDEEIEERKEEWGFTEQEEDTGGFFENLLSGND